MSGVIEYKINLQSPPVELYYPPPMANGPIDRD